MGETVILEQTAAEPSRERTVARWPIKINAVQFGSSLALSARRRTLCLHRLRIAQGNSMAETSLLAISLSADVTGARLAQLTRDLERDLSRSGIRTRPVEAPPIQGEKGEPVTLGVLTLALITHGAVTTLVECLKAYLSRERTLTFKFTLPNGTQVEVNARNVGMPAVREALEAAVSARSK